MNHRSKLFRLANVMGVILGLSLSVASGGDLRPLQGMAFLAGHWFGTAGQVEMEEVWTAPKGGVMLGLHRDVAPGKPAFFEYLRIEERGEAVVYVASPRGAGATDFVLVSLDEGEVVFENLDHDFPQRIIYQREGNRLMARIEGEVDGKLESSEWVWELVD